MSDQRRIASRGPVRKRTEHAKVEWTLNQPVSARFMGYGNDSGQMAHFVPNRCHTPGFEDVHGLRDKSFDLDPAALQFTHGPVFIGRGAWPGLPGEPHLLFKL